MSQAFIKAQLHVSAAVVIYAVRASGICSRMRYGMLPPLRCGGGTLLAHPVCLQENTE